MLKTDLEQFAKDVTGKHIKIFIQTGFGKSWYSQVFNSNFSTIEPETSYGVSVNDNDIVYVFKTGKNRDSFLKSFLTQYISKYEMKQSVWKDGEIVKPTKEDVINKLRVNDRVYKSCFYTTLYGIGFFCFLLSTDGFNKVKKVMGDYLDSLGIPYQNEFSEAGWVFRFLIGKDVNYHNEILEKFEF